MPAPISRPMARAGGGRGGAATEDEEAAPCRSGRPPARLHLGDVLACRADRPVSRSGMMPAARGASNGRRRPESRPASGRRDGAWSSRSPDALHSSTLRFCGGVPAASQPVAAPPPPSPASAATSRRCKAGWAAARRASSTRRAIDCARSRPHCARVALQAAACGVEHGLAHLEIRRRAAAADDRDQEDRDDAAAAGAAAIRRAVAGGVSTPESLETQPFDTTILREQAVPKDGHRPGTTSLRVAREARVYQLTRPGIELGASGQLDSVRRPGGLVPDLPAPRPDATSRPTT